MTRIWLLFSIFSPLFSPTRAECGVYRKYHNRRLEGVSPVDTSRTVSLTDCLRTCLRRWPKCLATNFIHSHESHTLVCEMFSTVPMDKFDTQLSATPGLYVIVKPIELNDNRRVSSVTVSSEQGTRPRSQAFDGDIEGDNGWSAASYDSPKWLQVDFIKEYLVWQVDILPRCHAKRQTPEYTIKVQGRALQFPRVCSGADENNLYCPTPWDNYSLPATRSGFLRVEADIFCDTSYYFYGIREMNIWGSE